MDTLKSVEVKKENIVKITSEKKDKTYSKDFFKPEKIDHNIYKTGYLAFQLQLTANKFGVTYDMILILLYLNELEIFSYKFKIIDRDLTVLDMVQFGFVYEDLIGGKRKLYKLTSKGKELVSHFNKNINNVDAFLLKNRSGFNESASVIKGVLDNYFH